MKKIILTALLAAAYGLSPGQKDTKFVQEAAMGNLMEIKLGELAMQNGYSEKIKQLGKSMKEDHSKAHDELMDLASKKGVTVPATLEEKEQKMYDKLAKKNAEDFDKAYARCMVKDHKKDICKFKKEAKKGDDAELKQWASNTVPVLEHHLRMSEDACRQVKKK